MATRTSFDSLSTELIVDILRGMHYLHLVHCRRVCKRLQIVIDGTPLLQYIIEFGAAGYFPARRPGSSVDEALEELRRVQKALRDPRPRLYRRVPLHFAQTYGTRPFRCFPVYRAITCGDISVAILYEPESDEEESNGEDARSLAILSLRSEDMPMEQRFRVLELNIRFQQFFVDAQQDLVILFDGEDLHFRSLTTGKIHPKITRRAAGFSTVPVYGVWTDADEPSIKVDGDWMLVVSPDPVDDDETYQLLWHWPTCRRFFRWPSDVMIPGTTVIMSCLCRGHLFVLVDRGVERDSPKELDVIALPENCGKKATHIASYELPPNEDFWDMRIGDYSWFSENLQSGVSQSMLYVYARASKFVVSVDALTMRTPGPFVGGCVPWEVWSPKTADISPYNAVTKAFGNTLVADDEMLSFNALDIAHDVYKPNTVRESTTVITQLPHRKTRIQVPEGESVFKQGSGMRWSACIVDGGPKFVDIVVRNPSEEERETPWMTCPTHLDIFTL